MECHLFIELGVNRKIQCEYGSCFEIVHAGQVIVVHKHKRYNTPKSVRDK